MSSQYSPDNNNHTYSVQYTNLNNNNEYKFDFKDSITSIGNESIKTILPSTIDEGGYY